MNKILYIIFALLLSLPFSSQAQSHHEISGALLCSNAHLFVSKYSADGELIWVTQANSSGSSQGFMLSSDSTAGIVCYCVSTNSVCVGDQKIDLSLQSRFARLHFDTTGSLTAPSLVADNINCDNKPFAVDKSGNTYVTGSYTKSFLLKNTAVPHQGSSDIFIAKYDNNHNLVWVQYAGGEFADAGLGIYADENGEVYVTGYTSSNHLFNPHPITIYNPNMHEKLGEISIYPNPTSAAVTLFLKADKPYQTIDVRIFDILGRTILVKTIASNSCEFEYKFNFENYSKGVYWIEVEMEQKRETRPVVVN